MNKRIVHDALILTAFTLALGLLLGFVYGITKDPIAKANEEATKAAYQAVFVDADDFNEVDYDKVSALIVRDLNEGHLGKVTFDE